MSSSDRPAVLGGSPMLSETLPIVRPALPAWQDIAEPLQEMLASGQVTRARFVRSLEEEAAQVTGAAHAVAVSNCTAGLMLALRGLEPGGSVIMPSFTFMATAAAVVWNGLRPLFADSDLDTMNVMPESVADLIAPDTQAILAVHNFGAPAPVEALQEIASRHHLMLLFDAAHGMGSRHAGEPIGRFGDAEVFSLSPTKVVVGCEGGLVTTNRSDLAEQIRVGREYGNPGSYDSVIVGLNARMSEPHAIVARWSLARVTQHVARRNEIARQVTKRLLALPGMRAQRVADGDLSSYKDLTIAIDAQQAGLTRDQVAGALRAEGVDTRAYYRPAIHQMTSYRRYAEGDHLPNTDQLAQQCLSLPIHSQMNDDTVHQLCAAVERIWAYRRQVRETVTSE